MLFPTACFAPISYFQELVKYPEVSILGAETYPKQTERNRFSIATSQGMQTLTIPVKRLDGSKTITSRIEIDHDSDWQKKHWKAIETAYNASPFFEHYSRDLYELMFQKEKSLLKYNTAITKHFLRLFGFETQIVVQNNFEVIHNEYFEPNFSDVTVSYQQVLFKSPIFLRNLSIIDLLCCEGPIGRKIIEIH
jgi:hypothetical protein